jgi:hypothetical protein
VVSSRSSPSNAPAGWSSGIRRPTTGVDHHLLFRSRGGGNERDNRITLCVWHHLHGVHGGVVRASGRVPDAVRWDLGVAADHPPLLRTLGDRYLDASGATS